MGMAGSSFALAGWMLVEPSAFWSLLGVPTAGKTGIAVSVQVLYAGAIFGEGVALLLIFFRPAQYAGFLHYMLVYKSVACIALARWLGGDEASLDGGWLLCGAWAAAGLIAGLIYPWGQWPRLLEHATRAREPGA